MRLVAFVGPDTKLFLAKLRVELLQRLDHHQEAGQGLIENVSGSDFEAGSFASVRHEPHVRAKLTAT